MNDDTQKLLDEIKTNLIKIKDKEIMFNAIKKFGVIEEFITNLNIEKNSKTADGGKDRKRLYEMALKLRNLERNATYLDEFMRLLTDPPYTLPANYFEPDTGPSVIIDLGGGESERYKTESAERALNICFPGSTTYRYAKPKKILCGRYSRNGKADLSAHKTSEKRIFELNGKDVYRIIELKARDPVFFMSRQSVCPICLSVSDGDETCHHQVKKMQYSKTMSSYVNKESVEIERHIKENPKKLRYPLNQIFDEISFLEKLRIGVALTGFSRSSAGTTTEVNYDKLIGYVIETKGIVFKLKPIDKDFIEKIFDEKYLIRDLLIDLISLTLFNSISDNGIPTYHTDLFASACIKALKLDHIDFSFDYKTILENIKEEDWIQHALQHIHDESHLYAGRIDISDEIIIKVFDTIRNAGFSKDEIIDHIHKLIIKSLSQLIFLSGCTVSGSSYTDLDFNFNSGAGLSGEILLYDSSNGANGSSQLIYEYLSLPEAELKINEEGELPLHRPRYLDETIVEYLLPCPQGIADRIHFQNLSSVLKEDSLSSSLKYLENLQKESPSTIDIIKQRGIQNIFPLGIGLRSVDDTLEFQRESEKLREFASICIHGCPDCISLGNKSKPNQFVEKYSISKYLLDMLFSYRTSEIRLASNTPKEKITEILQKYNIIIITKKLYKPEDNYDDLEKLISDLIGKQINGRFVKLSGKWFDCKIALQPYVEVAYMIGLT